MRPGGPATVVAPGDRVTTAPRWSASSGRTLSWALPKWSTHNTSAPSPPSGVGCEAGIGSPTSQAGRVNGLAQGDAGWRRWPGERPPGAKRSRPAKVAPPTGGTGKRVQLHRGREAPREVAAGRRSPLSGPTSTAPGPSRPRWLQPGGWCPRRGRPRPGSRRDQPGRRPPQSQGAGPDVVGRNLVGDVDDGDARGVGGDDPVHHARRTRPRARSPRGTRRRRRATPPGPEGRKPAAQAVIGLAGVDEVDGPGLLDRVLDWVRFDWSGSTGSGSTGSGSTGSGSTGCGRLQPARVYCWAR